MVIFLHGLGSNGQDLIGLAPHMIKSIPETVFISPDAPFPCDMVPAGYPNSHQWFSLQNRDPDVILRGLQDVQPTLSAFIDEQRKLYDMPADRCALVGFSQGTMTALYTALRYPDLAGVLGFSGAFFAGDKAQIINKPAIHLIHGESDDVVPVEAHAAAMESLNALDMNVTGYTQPRLTHSIDEKGLASGSAFLADVFKK